MDYKQNRHEGQSLKVYCFQDKTTDKNKCYILAESQADAERRLKLDTVLKCDLIGVQDIADERTIHKKLINEPIIIRNSIDPV